MAGVNVESGGGKRSVDSEINMVPMIDLLMCLICFLLITAVWSTVAKLDANAQVPGETKPLVDPPAPQPTLHVTIKDTSFVLAWKLGANLEGASVDIPRVAEYLDTTRKEKPSFPALRDEVQRQWATHEGMHRAGEEPRDQAVLHCDNTASYEEIIAVVDAVYQTRRKFPAKVVGDANVDKDFPAMNVSFAMASN